MKKIQLLSKKHDRRSFDCGQDEINKYLKQQANQNAKKSYSQTHVLIDDIRPSQIIGFYTLTSVLIDKPIQHQINIKYPQNLFGVNLARMGVDVNFQGSSFSEILIIDAIEKTIFIDKNMGSQGLFLDAKNDKLIKYYEGYGFELIVDKNKKMWMPIGTLKKL
ncbi:MAG: GNAT family N-acetyltransferase [Proteobacteria bacterium]|nr:GNAT family N-acetyltransferase [Pseudomonadota bacterium]